MYMNKLLAQLDTSSGYNNDEGFSRREFENLLSTVFSKGVSYFLLQDPEMSLASGVGMG